MNFKSIFGPSIAISVCTFAASLHRKRKRNNGKQRVRLVAAFKIEGKNLPDEMSRLGGQYRNMSTHCKVSSAVEIQFLSCIFLWNGKEKQYFFF